MDFEPRRGSEQGGHRPACVISRNEFNSGTKNVIVAAITTTRRDTPVTVHLPRGMPCDEEAWVLSFQLLTISQERLEKFVGRLNREQIARLDDALRLSFGL